jgi:hypothetical protein
MSGRATMNENNHEDSKAQRIFFVALCLCGELFSQELHVHSCCPA